MSSTSFPPSFDLSRLTPHLGLSACTVDLSETRRSRNSSRASQSSASLLQLVSWTSSSSSRLLPLPFVSPSPTLTLLSLVSPQETHSHIPLLLSPLSQTSHHLLLQQQRTVAARPKLSPDGRRTTSCAHPFPRAGCFDRGGEDWRSSRDGDEGWGRPGGEFRVVGRRERRGRRRRRRRVRYTGTDRGLELVGFRC